MNLHLHLQDSEKVQFILSMEQEWWQTTSYTVGELFWLGSSSISNLNKINSKCLRLKKKNKVLFVWFVLVLCLFSL